MTAEKPLRLRMAGSVTLTDAPRLAAQLSALPASRPVEIDASALEQTDAPVLQVLVAAVRAAAQEGRVLSVRLLPEAQPAQLAAELALGPFLAPDACTDPLTE
ncbi:MAG: STAS domain-containing protein [Cypionkella sp.]|jgi:ABC-type transporter Mla MlaB component|nr:STAS domain-containing protein [Cypionkella sp.]